MGMGQFEIIEFYLDLVSQAQERGIRCAITSGMACVAFEVAESTKDCDLLCDPEMADKFIALLAESPLGDAPCQYRGNISPPLDGRWLKGGWTSHFEWPGTDGFLDVFGIAPRARSSWLDEMMPPYAHPHIVADMKRTARDKDWPFITDLGLLLIEKGDSRGWLHLFDADLIQKLQSESPVPAEIISLRPALCLAGGDRGQLFAALSAERIFWQRTSEARLKYYEKHLKPYLVAVREAEAGQQLTLLEQHEIRLACAEAHLPLRPLGEAEFTEMIAEARKVTMGFIHPSLEQWLPDMTANYRILIPGLA
jgi:hypothetical protein